MIVVVSEINSDDPGNTFVVDLDRLPRDEYIGFRLAVMNAIENGGTGSIDTDYSFSYGEWCEDACIDPPCHIDAVVELYTND